jgi:hypothetical protein
METETIMSDGGRRRAPSIMSLDDPETREAAETLSGLRNMGMCHSPSNFLQIFYPFHVKLDFLLQPI